MNLLFIRLRDWEALEEIAKYSAYLIETPLQPLKMVEDLNSLPGAYIKREKLKGHQNWARWADLTRTLLEKEGPRRRATKWDQTPRDPRRHRHSSQD